MSAAHRLIGAAALCAAVLSSATISAQTANQIGQACAQVGQTVMSSIQQEGIIACIPNGNGNLFWQPENGGMARYDATTACNVAGQTRWNGSAMQYCDGANWQPFGGVLSGTMCGLWFTDWSVNISCGGVNIPSNGCPAGYWMFEQLAGYENTGNGVDPVQTFTCIKN